MQRRPRAQNRRQADPNIAAQIRAGNFKRLEQFPPTMNKLGDIVLNAKKDIKFRRNAATYDSAVGYARKHGLIPGHRDDDVNADGIPDVVLYDREGNPVIINGYELTKSEKQLRDLFHLENPNKADKIRAGGFTGFKNNFHERPNAAEFIAALGEHDARPPAPRNPERNTLYAQFSAMVSEAVNNAIAMRVGEDKTNAKSLVSAFTVISLVYLDRVIPMLWNHALNRNTKREIQQKYNSGNNIAKRRYNDFKSLFASNRAIVDQMFRSIADAALEPLQDEDNAYLNMLLDTCLLTEDNVARLPEDGVFHSRDQQAIIEGRLVKEDFKGQSKEAVEAFKAAKIEEIFGGVVVPRRAVHTPTIRPNPFRHVDDFLAGLLGADDRYGVLDNFMAAQELDAIRYLAEQLQSMCENDYEMGSEEWDILSDCLGHVNDYIEFREQEDDEA